MQGSSRCVNDAKRVSISGEATEMRGLLDKWLIYDTVAVLVVSDSGGLVPKMRVKLDECKE